MNAHPTGIHTEEQVAAIQLSDSATAIREYLTLMEDSESPRVYLTWSLLAVAGGLLGRNAAFYSGPNHVVTPNLYVILIGPSAVRKSSAINMIAKFLKGTSVNLGPTDTGGQRHGIMSALTGLHRTDGKPWRHKADAGPLTPAMIHQRAPSDLLLLAPELGRLMGSSSREMADFLVDLYDGAPVDYQTKAGETRLNDPLATLLAATVPSSLAAVLPENAVSHGIISRMLFVYADELHKQVPLPVEPSEEWLESRERFAKRLRWIDANRVNFGLDSAARRIYADLYDYVPLLEDPRLESYRGRRSNHLIKVGICIAALRNDTTVIESDLLLAHELLHAIEPKMHRALEYFGRNKTYQGRMLILQFLRSMGEAGVSNFAELTAAAASELTQREAQEAIESMIASGELRTYAGGIMLGTAKNAVVKARRNKGDSR